MKASQMAKLPPRNRKVADMVTRIRSQFLMSEPFLGHLMVSMPFIEWQGDPAELPTAATDGRVTYYNASFFESLHRDEVAFVMLHEVAHCMLQHLWRLGSRDPRLWNVACDHVMNRELMNYSRELDARKSPVRLRAPQSILADPRFNDMTAERAYSILEQEQKAKRGKPGGAASGAATAPSSGPGSTQAGPGNDPMSGQGEGDQDAPEGQPEAKSDGKPGEFKPCQPSGGIGDFIPQDPEEPGEDDDSGKAASKTLAQQWAETAVKAEALARLAGKGSNAGARMMGQAIAKPIDWKEILLDLMVSAKEDYNWMRPNRRYMSSGFLLPSLHAEHFGRIVIGVDTSGSIDGNTLKEFEGVVRMIVDAVRPDSVLVLYCDDQLVHEDEFGHGEAVALAPHGGGGTDFRPVFKRLEQETEEILAVIYLTDLMGMFPSSGPDCRTVWASTTGLKAPFGETVHIRE
jgi:predicted metal-dependent peptidase